VIYRTKRALGWIRHPEYTTCIFDKGTVVVYLGEFFGSRYGANAFPSSYTLFQHEGKIIYRFERLDEMASKLDYIEIL